MKTENYLKELDSKLKEGNFIEIEKIIKNNIKNFDNKENLRFLLALSLLQQKKFKECDNHFQHLIVKNIMKVESCYHLGLSLKAQRRFHEAIKILEFHINEPNKLILNLLGNLYRDIGNLNEAKRNLINSLKLDENFIESVLLLTMTLADLGEFKEAKNLINKHSNLENERMLNCLAYILMEEGENEKARDTLLRIVSINSQNKMADYNLAIIDLSNQNFSDGWKRNESRFYTSNFNFSNKVLSTLSKPRWDIQKPYSRVLIWGEQGIGDQILFSKYLDVIQDRFEKIIICITKKLVPIFKNMYPHLKITSFEEMPETDEYDFHIPLLSLGLYFHEDLNIIPTAKINYTFFNTENLIPKKLKKIRCGISWVSKSGVLTDKKSLKLELFKDIFKIQDIEFINLQYTDQSSEISILEKQLDKKIFVDHNIDCFDDIVGLANLMQSCDFIISVSNSSTHLAGKVGIKTFLLLPYRSGNLWYWYNTVNDYSFWYPSIKLIRQKQDLNWESVLNNLKNEIQNITLNS